MTKMSIKRHLREFQWRLMLVAAFFIIGASLAYAYQSTLIPLLLSPLEGQKLVYLNPAGGFSFIFMISIYAGIALAFPALLQQIYSFLRPILPTSAQRKSTIIIISSLVLLIVGIAFGYIVAVPSALNFLYSFADQYVEASLTAESYLNFMIAYTIGIGIVFQLPLLLLLLHTIKPLTPGGLMKSEKWVVLGAFIVAAIITPTPDPINQVIIAGPVVVIYQIGVIAVLLTIAKTRRLEKSQKRAATPRSVAPILAPTKATPQPLATQTTLTAAPPISTQHHLVKTMDGILVPRGAPRLQVPKRENSQPIVPPVRTQPAQSTAIEGRKNFYIDGIIAPRQVTSF